jgi:hypothetical protein
MADSGAPLRRSDRLASVGGDNAGNDKEQQHEVPAADEGADAGNAPAQNEANQAVAAADVAAAALADAPENVQMQAAMSNAAAVHSGATASRAPVGSDWNVDSLTAAFANARVHKVPECFKLPTFKGSYEESKHVPSFIKRVDAYFTYHKIGDSTSQLAALYSCFPIGTPAALWFEDTVTSMYSFEDFQVQFRERFHLQTADRAQYITKLESFHQRSTDNVISYYTGLTEIFNILSQLGVTFLPLQMKHKFISGLRPHLRAVVLTQESISELTLQKALTIAMNYECNMPPVRAAPALQASGVGDNANQADAAVQCGYCKRTGHVTNVLE